MLKIGSDESRIGNLVQEAQRRWMIVGRSYKKAITKAIEEDDNSDCGPQTKPQLLLRCWAVQQELGQRLVQAQKPRRQLAVRLSPQKCSHEKYDQPGRTCSTPCPQSLMVHHSGQCSREKCGPICRTRSISLPEPGSRAHSDLVHHTCSRSLSGGRQKSHHETLLQNCREELHHRARSAC